MPLEEHHLRREIIPPAMEKKQEGKYWALLVGVNHYDDSGISDLMFCVNDVKALEETLTKLGYEVSCLHDELDEKNSPTRQNVKIKLSILCQVIQPDDLLWVHFSCHGTLAPNKKEPVLILKDTQHLLLHDESEVLSVAQVENYMRNSGARKLILTLDACHSGVNIGRDVSDQKEFFQNVYEQAEGFALLAAATANQQAYEDVKNGIFTNFLLQGLNSQEVRENQNYITVYQLYTYVLNELRKWGVSNNKLQFPTERVEGLGDIILAYYQEDDPPDSDDDLSSDRNVDYTRLRNLLKAGNWKDADYETYLVMLQVVGCEKGNWIRNEELLNFPCTDLRTIDSLWVKYSSGRFGFSVQKKIYLEVGGKPNGKYYEEAWKNFGDRVGWRKGWLNKWISYSEKVIFDTSAPSGHLPARVYSSPRGLIDESETSSFLVCGAHGTVSSLASRLVNCSL